jgi:hypothetical protein
MPKKQRPTVLADEHILEPVIDALRDVGLFRVMRANQDHRFRGRDEWTYIRELRSLNIIFLTQDGEFVRHVVSDGVRHAGIIWLPPRWAVEELATAVAAASGILSGQSCKFVRGG